MKIVILSRSPESYSTSRLREACKKSGHQVRVLDTLRFAVVIQEDEPTLVYRQKTLTRYDAVIPRIGASITDVGATVVRQFEQMGVFTLASSRALMAARDKLQSLQMLSRHRMPVPATIFVNDETGVVSAIDRLGGPPVVLKVREGTQGSGVVLADDVATAVQVVESLQRNQQHVLVQRFVAESQGCDVRAFVVGGRVVAAMRRIAQEGDFRSNLHCGGRTEKVKLDEETQGIAVRAAQIVGLSVAGVDMLESADGPLVIEVNASPGLEGIELTTGVDVADEIVAHLEEHVLLPEVDLFQRLTTNPQYAVAEFRVGRASEWDGRTLAELQLKQADLTILRIQRGEQTVHNPRGEHVLKCGDVLVCYGPRAKLKPIIPTDPRGRRRRWPWRKKP